MIPTRTDAWNLLCSYTTTDSLRRHALAVEAVMRYTAQKRGHDPEKWGVIGLVHDLDWEMYPEQHCTKTEEFLRAADWPEEYIRAVLAHAWGMFTEVEPQHEMEKVLYTIDELTGLVSSTALVRPSKSILDMKVKSVKKKWNEKSFAAGVDRSVIERGAAMLGIDVAEAIEDTIMGMRAVAEELGLSGSVDAASSELE